MNTPTLRTRIRNGSLALLVLVVLLGVYTLPRVYRLGGAIRETLYRNYISIEAAQHMHAALRTLEVAELEGRAPAVLPAVRADFSSWMNIEDHDFTEVGEPQLAMSIQSGAASLFDAIAAAPIGARHDAAFDALHARIDDLIAMNKLAMFRADSRAAHLGRHLSYDYATGLALVLILGTALSWWLGWTLSKPLTDIAERLRGVSQRRAHLRLGAQKLGELDAVAREFNEMAERLEQYDQLNVDRLVYEKSKTEAIIESLEDGVVLIDLDGVVIHINETAALIIGLEQNEALGSAFDDLSSNNPHYIRVRDALRTLKQGAPTDQRVEVQLHFRGRDHAFVLKPIPLRHAEGRPLGTIVILQDVTYLRDQDRARTNLVATLSHELRTPITSLALSAELLRREESVLGPRQRELAQAILEECARLTQLSDNLLTLARGSNGIIAIEHAPLDLARIVAEVSDRFNIQAGEKGIALHQRIDPMPMIAGDSVKLSWVVSNLVGNALRYTPHDGVIEVTAHAIDGVVRIEVADSGPGIPADVRDYIFEKYTQFGDGRAERGAAGLGLAIAKDIVQAHSGRIFVESPEGGGSRFIVELPMPPRS
ncbi:MAG TPA: ATP-binding protein [Candidatus Binataceae bacterium]|nr:ATP-binding protein [Candidatus Binataceae bacterium]